MYWMHYYSDPDQHIPGRDIAILWLISAPGSIPLCSYCLYYILDWFYIPFNTSWPWIIHFYGAFIVVHCPCWLVIKFYILLEPSHQKA